jgi:hypothetical protein
MKKLVKELARREGKKSATSIANIREVLKHFAEIYGEDLIDEENKGLVDEWCEYVLKTRKKIEKKRKKRA